MADRQKVVVIGAGGIGKALLTHLCRYLNYDERAWKVIIVDGDDYEEGNAKRQSFRTIGNKAVVSCDELLADHRVSSNLVIEAVPLFVAGNEDEIDERFVGKTVLISDVIQDSDTVFVCVDNHKTRLTVSKHCQTLRNVRLISMGNETVNGNVQVYVRKNGRDLFQPIEEVHPEIKNPKARAPHELSCDDRVENGSPQTSIANLMAATFGLAAFYAELERANQAGEIFFTIVKVGTAVGPMAVAFERKPISKS